VRGLQKPVNMLFQSKNSRSPVGSIRTNSFKYADAVVQASIDEWNIAVLGVSQPIINPDISWVRHLGLVNGCKKVIVELLAGQGFMWSGYSRSRI
jgi:hypothetical protein